MWEAIISGAAAIVVCVISGIAQRKAAEKQHRATIEAAEKQHNTTIALIEYKLDQLTHKVELHNNAVERLYAAEQKIAVHGEKLDTLERMNHHD